MFRYALCGYFLPIQSLQYELCTVNIHSVNTKKNIITINLFTLSSLKAETCETFASLKRSVLFYIPTMKGIKLTSRENF